MIKLFWNTHNQNKDTTDKEKREKFWGLYHRDNSNTWIYEILNQIKFYNVNSEEEIESKDTVIIVDSSIENKSDFYDKLKLISSKMFLIHLGDEAGTLNLSSTYNKFNYVWRTFCSNKYFKNNTVSCIPLGYKSGVKLTEKNTKREYKWSFVGTPHKSSRHDLLFQLSDIKPAYSYKTEKFDKKILSVNEMSKKLSQSEFVPCPNGFVHPETYRTYEALECECIPIVENSYRYYDRLFSNNPFIKIDKWKDAKEIIGGWTKNQIEEKREECKLWWQEYKKNIQENIKKVIS